MHSGTRSATANKNTEDPDLDFHDTGPFIAEGKGKAAKLAHMKWLGMDCLGVCVFTTSTSPLKLYSDALAAVTGWDMNVMDIIKCVERSVTLSRLFNFKHGFTLDDDLPSKRILEPPYDGPAKGISPIDHVKTMLVEYYQEMGWDPITGKPKENMIE